jgi:hypothetical protein
MFWFWAAKLFVSDSSSHFLRSLVPVVHMISVGEALLRQRGYNLCGTKMGFHVPPFTSVQHLHLHCMSLPLKNLWREIK